MKHVGTFHVLDYFCPCKFQIDVSFCLSAKPFSVPVVCYFFHLQQWTDDILKMANNLLALNGSVHYFLRKAHVRLTLQADKGGRIAVKK